MTNRKIASVLGGVLAGVLGATPSLAQDNTLVVTHNRGIYANWEMHTDDSYVGMDAGCFETLVRVDENLQIYPWLSTSWNQVDDLTWEIALREGVKYQDGTAMTADTVAAGLNRLLAGKIQARTFSNKIVDKVTAKGANTIVVTTKTKDVLLPGRLSTSQTALLAPAAYAGEAVNPIGTCTGPFRITSFEAKQHINAVANPDYWGGAPKLDGVQLRFIPDANTRAAMIRSGEAQLSILLPSSAVGSLKEMAGLKVNELYSSRNTLMLFNTKRAPFDNLKVREAIRLAIDTAGISGAVFEGYAPAAASPFRPTEPWAPKDAAVVSPDLEKAKEILKESGIDFAGKTFKMEVYAQRTELRPVAEIIQAALAELGISIEVNVQDYGVYEPKLLKGEYDLAMFSRGYLIDAPEPLGYFTADYSCKGSFNMSQYCDPEFDSKLATAATESDPAKRFAIYGELAQHLNDNAVSVFVVHEPQFEAISEKLENYKPHPLKYYSISNKLSLK